VTTIQFTIRRDPEKKDPEGIEYWVYEEVIGASQRGKYIVISMQDRSAIIPGHWVVDMKEL
tara:strand:- start:294 stop:476 length:183 start_codon:yes stop_codon:yes gene_type:complete